MGVCLQKCVYLCKSIDVTYSNQPLQAKSNKQHHAVAPAPISFISHIKTTLQAPYAFDTTTSSGGYHGSPPESDADGVVPGHGVAVRV